MSDRDVTENEISRARLKSMAHVVDVVTSELDDAKISDNRAAQYMGISRTRFDLAKLRALAEAATQHWFVVDDGSDRPRALTFDGRNSLLGIDVDGLAIVYKREDAAFIGACTPRVALALIAEIERLEAERDARPAITAEDARGWADAREAFYEPTLDEKAAWERVDDALHAHAKKAVPR